MSGRRDFPALRVVEHALARHWLGRLRDERTDRSHFRRALAALSRVLVAEATRDLPLHAERRETPVAEARVGSLEVERMMLVPILRAGLGMLPAALELLPGASVGFIGLERDSRTWRPREYLVKLPPDGGGPVLVLDPMLATGGSAAHTCDVLRAHGVEGRRMRLVVVVAAPEGVRAMQDAHPEVRVVAAALDSHLDAAREIVPGVGDAGDRLFGAG